MTIRVAAITLIVASASLLPLEQSHAQLVRAVSPTHLVLQRADVPAGFRQTVNRVVTNATQDKVSHQAAGTFASHGRLTAYETDFQRSGRSGLLLIQDTVASYRSTAGAHWQLQFSAAQAHKGLSGNQFKAISAGHLGDEAIAYQVSLTSGSTKLAYYIVVFRRGAYAAGVIGASLPHAASAADLIRLAQVVDGRIQRGH